MVPMPLDIVIFTVLATIMGIIVYLITYRIYRLTKGGSKGWLYLGTVGFAASFWAVLGYLVGWRNIIGLLTEIIVLPIMLVFVVVTTTTLASDMKIKRPEWFTTRNAMYYLFVVFVLVLSYNLFTPIYDPLRELVSIVMILMPFAFLVAAFGGYVIYRGTGKSAWIAFLIGSLLIMSATFMATYRGNCCGVPNPSSSLCEGYDRNYVPSHPIPCVESFLYIAILHAYFTVTGMIFYIISFLLLWIPMEFLKIPKK